MLKRIHFATALRGFFKTLLEAKNINASMTSENTGFYEVNSPLSAFVKSIGRLKIFDYLGFIKIIKAEQKDCDVYGSFNRFLSADKPYFIYVENPTALFHYRLNRSKTLLGRRCVRKSLNNDKLKALVCMSKACFDTFDTVCGNVAPHCKKVQIYPLVKDNQIANVDFIKDRSQKHEIKLLYIAQGTRFVSKGGLEVIEAFKQMKSKGMNVLLTMVTSFFDANSEALELAKNTDGIILCDFKFSPEEMQKLYASHHIMLIPTSDDSFNLTVLEAIKAGLPIIGSCLYAIPEMVIEGENGFLCEPAWWFFGENKMPNPAVWNHREKTIYSGKINSRVIDFLYEKVVMLYEDREKLEEMSQKSYSRANSAPFSEEYIVNQWNELLDSICKLLFANLLLHDDMSQILVKK